MDERERVPRVLAPEGVEVNVEDELAAQVRPVKLVPGAPPAGGVFAGTLRAGPG